jgi:CHRD domain/PEP-CTERM motif
MYRLPLKIGALVLAAASALPASAATFVYFASLNGNNENPVVNTPGVGNALVTVDDVANTMRVQITFGGLVGNTTASHIHFCAAFPANAGVATQTPTFAGFPLGVKSGAYDNLFDMTLASSFNTGFLNNATNGGNVATARATLFNGMAAGQSYLNVHSTFAPGGEIRGQLVANVPEAATWGMMIIGFGLAGIALRRQKWQPQRV